MRPERPRLLPAYLLSAFKVLVAAFASLPVTETAAVRVTAPLQRLETNVLITVAARHIDAEITNSQQGTTRITQAPAEYASGEVTFTFRCVPTIVCKPAHYASVPQGVVVATANHVRYATQAAVQFVGPGDTAMANAPVRALTPGAAGNTGSHTITIMERRQSVPSLTPLDVSVPITTEAS